MQKLLQVNQYTPVVSPGYTYGYNQLLHDSSPVTWSIMTDIGGDSPCSPNLNDSLNGLSPDGEIHYTINGYSYTTKKVNPYTCIQTNDITKQQRTLKSSLWDNNPDLSSDNLTEYTHPVGKLGVENSAQWYFYNDSNCKQFINVNLSLKLSHLPIGGSIFHYKTCGFMYNFIKNSHTKVFQRNVITAKTRTLNLDINYNTTTRNNKNKNSKNVNNGDKKNQFYMNNNANCSTNLSNHINNNNKQKTFKNQKCWYFKSDDGTVEDVDVFLCEKFNQLNIGEKYRYYSEYGRYEAVVISNCHIKQTNLDTGTKRDITTTTTTATATATNHTNETNKLYGSYTINCNTTTNVHVATHKTPLNTSSNSKSGNPNPSQWQFNSRHNNNTNPITTNIKSKSKSKSKSNINHNMNQRNSSNLTSTTNTNCNINYANMTDTSNCKCNIKVDNTKKLADKATQTLNKKQTGYKKLANLSEEEIKTMFFGPNGVDPNYYRITSIDEIDEPQLNMIESIYNSQINRVRISQTQENNGSIPKETEKWLWHGTNVQVVDKILMNGFDRNYNKMSAYGIGVYFARYPSYSRCYCENYSKKTHNGDLCMLLCKVIVGDVTKGRYNLRNIPYKKDGVTQFETLVDNVKNPTVYVVTRDFMAIPKYKIWFRSKSSK